MGGPILDQLNIVSSDFGATRAFYRVLGVEKGQPARNSAGEPFHASHRPPLGAAIELDSPAFAGLWNRLPVQASGRI